MHPSLQPTPEVADALAAGRPVVALESTIISHGMPYPQNVQTAREVEAIVRAEGAVPATIAVSGGRIHVGLSPAELEHLATAKDVAKVSRRDLPYVLATGATGATTVAATMIAAHLAGIRIFVTGGIGGVHRGAETSFDISADLTELARTPVAVVCAGAKSILDLGLTLEYLETQGVPVIGYGTDRFPAFFTRDSGFPADFRLDTPEAVAGVLAAQGFLGYPGGAVVANPIPEAAAMPKAEIDAIIAQALEDAARGGITGKRVTPFLLERINTLTGGRSLASNIALVKHNAEVGARIAKALQAGKAPERPERPRRDRRD
jgi:pseudouridine-5'-phosphate glycosidase